MKPIKHALLLAFLGIVPWTDAQAAYDARSVLAAPDARHQLCLAGHARACRLADLAENCREGRLNRCLMWHRETESLLAGDPVLGSLRRK